MLLWQLARNAQGDDPTLLESALVGKSVPVFTLESLDNPGKTYDQSVLTRRQTHAAECLGDLVPDLPGRASISERPDSAGRACGRA